MNTSENSEKNDWFFEQNEAWDGQAFGLKIKQKLLTKKSEFQKVEVFSTEEYGNMLVLDGVIQMTERDEFAYQEMISHLPLTAHTNPKSVLVIGGGDGGCVREILKHDSVERIDLVEIDPTVIEISRKYFPNMSSGLNSERVHIHICDGFEYLKTTNQQYDVVISDSSDPDGPAEVLFQEKYFNLLSDVTTPSGIISLQASENIWLNLQKLQNLMTTCGNVFPQVKFASVCVPSYTSGQLGLLICSKSNKTDLKHPRRKWSECSTQENQYYTEEMHEASFVLPNFACINLNLNLQ